MRNCAEGLIVALIGLGAVWGAYQVPSAQDGETWAGLVPMVVAVGLTLGGVLMVIDTLKQVAAENAAGTGISEGNEESTDSVGTSRESSSTVKTVIGVAVLAFVYQYAIVAFGYLLPTALVAPVVLYVFGVRSVPGLLLSMVLCPLVFHLIFFELLGVFPPYGDVFEPLDLIRS